MNATLSDTATSPAHPSARRKAATRERICDAANRLFFERGFSSITMEQIAAEAGIQRSTLYLHFREKDEILAAIAEDYIALLRPIISGLPGPVPTLEQLRLWIAAFARFVGENCAATELLVSLSHMPKAPLPAVEFGQALLAMIAEQLPAVSLALQPGNHEARARAITVLDTLGWALCNHARTGETPLSQARLDVAAEGLHLFICREY